MKFTYSLAALAASASAQGPELVSGRNGRSEDLLVSRRETISLTEQQSTMMAMSATVGALSQQMASLSSQDGVVAMGAKVIADGMTARTDKLLIASTENKAAVSTMQSTLTESLAALDSQMADVLSRTASTAAAMSTSLGAALEATESRVAQDAISLQRSLNASAAAQASDAAAARAQLQASVSNQISTVNGALANKANAKVHMWTGGCGNHGGTGWTEYCLDRVHYDSSAPIFRKASNTRFVASQNGFFHIDWFGSKRTHGWGHTRVYVDGQIKTYVMDWHGWNDRWHDADVQLTWPVRQNQQFWIYSYCHPGHWQNWHATSGSGLTGGGYHSRMTITYMGPYTP